VNFLLRDSVHSGPEKKLHSV